MIFSSSTLSGAPRFGLLQKTIPGLVLIAIALAYLPTLFVGFAGDDFFNVLNALNAGWSPTRLARGFVISFDYLNDGWMLPDFDGAAAVRYFRPLFLVSLLLDHAIWGLWPVGFHFTNILLHLAVVAAFYAVLLELLGVERRSLAALGALLYGIMPFNGIAAWISGRTEVLPALAMMRGLWAWLRFARERRWSCYVLALACAIAALLSKENAVIFPLILFAAWLWIARKPRPSIWLLAPFVLLVVGYLFARAWALGGFPTPPASFYYHPPTEPGFPRWALAKAACSFYLLFFHLPLIFPLDLILREHPWISVAMLALAAAIAVGFALLIRGSRDAEWRRLGAFAAAWAIIGILPTAPITVFPLYTYFPLAGVTILYLIVLNRLGEVERRPQLARILPRALTASLVAMFLAGLLVGHLLLVFMGRDTRHIFGQIKAEIAARPERHTRLFFIDAVPIVFTLKPALALEYPDRTFEIHMLSEWPYITPKPHPVSRIERPDPRTLVLTAPGRPYFSGAFGLLAFAGKGRGILREGATFPVHDYSIELTDVETWGRIPRRCVRTFTIRFDRPIEEVDGLFLYFTPGSYKKMQFPKVRSTAFSTCLARILTSRLVNIN